MLNSLSLRLRPLAVAAALFAVAGAAQADVTFFTSEEAFQSYLARPVTDDYADLSASVGQDLGTPVPRTAGSFGYSLYAYNLFASDADTIHVTGTADNPSISSTNNYSILIVDDMFGGANAFGAYVWGANGADAFQSVTINFEVLDAAGVDKMISFTPTAADQGSFIGVISNTALQIVNAWIEPSSVSGDMPYAVMDNVTLGVATPVPEPTSYALMLGGLAALGVVARRRKAKNS